MAARAGKSGRGVRTPYVESRFSEQVVRFGLLEQATAVPTESLCNIGVYVAILVSWGIAFFEYCLQVPANRTGIQSISLPQLKVIQEMITMIVFAGFAVFYMRQSLRLDFLWAGLCLMAAAFFMFRGGTTN